ncbi:uncharacterized protein [Rutidosis leptorrhynchoides]|uniref:uncharacterized protein n=1 Tax=Rutidosis leptorrhynchoides TaxID=125765 RepID=UPI003A997598
MKLPAESSKPPGGSFQAAGWYTQSRRLRAQINATSESDKMSIQHTLIIGSDFKPPVLFDGEYYQWLQRITQFIDYKVEKAKYIWASLKDGPITVFHQETGLPLPVYELFRERRERAQGDIEAKNIIMQYIPYDLFEYVDSNTSAKDIWDRSKGNKKEHEELLKDAYRRVNGVLNELKKCNIPKVHAEINMKFLKKLNSDWLPYGTIIQFTKKIDKLNIQEFVGVLMHYQPAVSKLQAEQKESTPSDPLALIAKKKSKSYTTSKILSMKVLVEDSTDSEGLSLSNKPEFLKPQPHHSKDFEKEDSLCYNCGKDGHYSHECKMPKKKDTAY